MLCPKSSNRLRPASRAAAAARTFAAVLWFALCLTAANAQSPATRIEGIVQDQTGAPIAGARVTLRNASALVAETETDLAGRFRFDGAAMKDATLFVRAQGFSQFESRIGTN